jgi:glycosyltransferase involved in cell wall biosynthesis
LVRRFHAPSAAVLVVSPAIRDELSERGFRNLVPWSRGVDIAAFKPQPREAFKEPRPIWLYTGRVAIEKNIKAFLDLDLPGTKWVVGGGPQLKSLQRRYTNAHFFGSVDTDELSYRYAQADCFVFPSVTDTFGLVMVEALASGVPVAGYPVPGPLDVVTDPKVGALDRDLRTACLAAVSRDPEDCRRHAETFTWERCARQFLNALQMIPQSHWQPLRNRVLPDAAAP